MTENIIYNDNDETIGYFKDIYALYEELLSEKTKEKDIEEAESLIQQMKDLMEYEDYDGLLVLSENNGMGFTVNKYKGE